MKRPAAVTVSLVVLSQAVHFLTFSGLALMLPLIRADLGISFAQAGMLSAAATASYALAQIPAGFLTDRYGAKRLFFTGLAGWSIFALALAALSSFQVAVIVLFVAGACRALLFAPGIVLVSSWFPAGRKATAISFFVIGSFIGTIVLSMTAPHLASAYGWRTTFAFFALLGLAMAAIFWSFAAEAPRDAKTRRAGAGDVRRVLASPIMWLCNGLQFVRFSAATAFNFWLPTFLLADRGYTLVHAGLVVGLSAACAAAANPFGGYVSDRLRNPPLVIGGSLAVVACTSALLVTVDSTPALLAVIGLNSIFMTVYFGPLFFVPVEALGQRTAGLTTGVGNLFANLGALVSAYALGFLKDATGDFAAGFYALSALCAVGVVLSVVLARLRTAHRSGSGSFVTATRTM